jgi:hypothetical protein
MLGECILLLMYAMQLNEVMGYVIIKFREFHKLPAGERQPYLASQQLELLTIFLNNSAISFTHEAHIISVKTVSRNKDKLCFIDSLAVPGHALLWPFPVTD